MLRALTDRLWAATRPDIGELVYANGGLGDELMLTAIARAARANGRPIHVLTYLPVLWAGNRDAVSVQTDVERWLYTRRRGWIDTDVRHLRYDTRRAGRHIAQQMADHLALTLPSTWRPVLTIERPMAISHRQIVIQNSCRGARYTATTKEWPAANWQNLVGLLSDFTFVQLGTPADPPLKGVVDMRGKTSLVEAARLISESACFVGLESGLMHVAAAVETPAVIIYGGRTEPSQTGYPCHRHATRQPPCAGCGLNTGCPHDMICMNIPAEEVAEHVRAACRPASPNH